MRTEFLKWWQTMRVAWSGILAYRLNFLLMVIGPALVFFFIKYNLWSAIYGLKPDSQIQGYSFQTMIIYQAYVMIVGLMGQGHTSMDLSEDIRLGRISSYLIYPFDFWQFHTAAFLAFQGIQIPICVLTLGLLRLTELLPEVGLQSILLGVGFTLMVSLLWFALQYLCGLMAFWLEETWILRVILLIISQFLSGAVIPLELFPEQIQRLLVFTPFPYLTYIPVKIFMGQATNLTSGCLILGIWILVTWGLAAFVWKRGLRLYSAAGM
jgi:ABC-2 type transport system permease protein